MRRGLLVGVIALSFGWLGALAALRLEQRSDMGALWVPGSVLAILAMLLLRGEGNRGKRIISRPLVTVSAALCIVAFVMVFVLPSIAGVFGGVAGGSLGILIGHLTGISRQASDRAGREHSEANSR